MFPLILLLFLFPVAVSSSAWVNVTRDVKVAYKLEDLPLQVKTHSSEVEKVAVKLYTAAEGSGTKIGAVGLRVYDAQYSIERCTGATPFPVPLPEETAKLWTITKNSSALVVACNSVPVLEFLYSSVPQKANCVPKYVQDVQYIEFSEGYGDTSSVYRAKPTACSGLPEGWTRVTTSQEFPVNDGTPLAVACQEGYRNTGSEVVTCNTYMYEDYSYEEKPECFAENAWRDDDRCGASFLNAAGDPGECDPDNPDDATCCSLYGWCGNSTDHCNCETCIDYSHTDVNDTYPFTPQIPYLKEILDIELFFTKVVQDGKHISACANIKIKFLVPSFTFGLGCFNFDA